MTNKIYIVSYYLYDFDGWGIYKYCSTEEIAKEKKQQLLDKIQNIKTTYYLEFNKDYNTDFSVYNDSDYLEEEWNEIADRVNIYRARYEELNYSDIKIEEKELI